MKHALTFLVAAGALLTAAAPAVTNAAEQPRQRLLMDFGWKRLIPAAAIWVVLFSGMTTFFGAKKTPPSTVAVVQPALGQVSR